MATSDSPRATHPLSSAEASKAWFRGLSSGDPKNTIDSVSLALVGMPRGGFEGPAAVGTLEALETLRKPLHALIDDLAPRYTDKALPLSETQRSGLDDAVSLSFSLAYAYYSLIREAANTASPLHEHEALVHQRALSWTVQGMVEHLRARQRFADKDWDLAQDVLQSAARHQLLEKDVRDSLHPQGVSTVTAAYSRLLLLHLLGARSMTTREFETAREFAFYFDGKVDLTYLVADSQGVVAGLHKTEEGDPTKTLQVGGLLHFMHIAGLARSLSGRIDALGRGQTFDTPRLTNPPSLASLRTLMVKLHRSWCARSNQRQFPRRRRDEKVYCAFEAPAIYALMKRHPYVAPPPPRLYDHAEVANIYLNRDSASSADARRAHTAYTPETWAQARAQLELWQSLEESASGTSMLRLQGGARVRQGQLIALRMGDAGVAMIGTVRWAEQAASNAANASGDARIDPGHTVEVGVQLLPGLARAGAVRYIGAAAAAAAAGKGGSSAALILDHFSRRAARDGAGELNGPNTIIPGLVPARVTAKADLAKLDAGAIVEQAEAGGPYRYSDRATVVLPAGWSREGEVIEFIDAGNSFKMRLGKQMFRHGDFDRMHFEVVNE